MIDYYLKIPYCVYFSSCFEYFAQSSALTVSVPLAILEYQTNLNPLGLEWKFGAGMSSMMQAHPGHDHTIIPIPGWYKFLLDPTRRLTKNLQTSEQ
jgi:hypothetical protein